MTFFSFLVAPVSLVGALPVLKYVRPPLKNHPAFQSFRSTYHLRRVEVLCVTSRLFYSVLLYTTILTIAIGITVESDEYKYRCTGSSVLVVVEYLRKQRLLSFIQYGRKHRSRSTNTSSCCINDC